MKSVQEATFDKKKQKKSIRRISRFDGNEENEYSTRFRIKAFKLNADDATRLK
jgi:hypothetical protein